MFPGPRLWNRVISTTLVTLVASGVLTMGVGPTGAASTAQPPSLLTAAWSVDPAVEAARRLIGNRVKQFRFVAEEETAEGGDHFRISAANGQIVIGGTSPGVLLRGLGTYLADHGMDISWNGEQLGSATRTWPLPATTTFTRATARHRFAFNDTDDGYTGAYRSWDDWQRMIDVLALKGINEVFMPVGAEAVYLDTFRQFGYTQDELLRWIPQPAHQPWWLLQNMCCFPSAVTRDLVEKRAALGGRIADRLHELGMTPVLPGYFGTVPPGFADRNPDAVIVPQGSWVGFPRPDWLDPTSAPFADVAAAFYASSERRFGASSMYKMDLLHEGGSPGDADVPAAAKAVEAALQTAHPHAIWAILGWQSNPRPETLSLLDKSRMLVVDGVADRYDGLDRERDWNGTPYAFGSIWNFGGHTTMGANIGEWNRRYWAWKAKPGSTMNGIALLPEGSENNPAALDFLASMAWEDGPVDLDQWFADWAARRYGGDDHAAQRAWRTIGATAYDMPAGRWSEAHEGLFSAEPSLSVTKAAEWSPEATRYDTKRFAEALPELLAVAPALRESSAYRYDLLDVTRQVLSNHSRELLPLIRSAYANGDRAMFGQLTAQWLEEMRLLEEVTGTSEQTMLGPWLRDIDAWGGTTAQIADRRHDARSLLSVWGHRAGYNEGLGDYANREWAGLISSYYLPRWKEYFDELDAAMAEGREPRAIDWFAYGDAWARDTSAKLATAPRGDIHEIAQRVHDHLAVESEATLGRRTLAGGESTSVEVTLVNGTDTQLTDSTATVSAPEGWTLEPATQTRTGLAPDATWNAAFTATWNGPEPTDTQGFSAEVTYTIDGASESRTMQIMWPNRPAIPGNLAERMTATQSSTDWDGTPERAVDGNTSGSWGSGSLTHTQEQVNQPWWQVDLGQAEWIGSVELFNRTDCCSERLTDPVVLLSDAPLPDSLDAALATPGVVSVRYEGTVRASALLKVNAHKRYVRVQLPSSTGTLSLAEVVVRAPQPETGPPPSPGAGTHYLSDLPFWTSTGGHGPWERDMHNGESAAGDGGPIMLAGTTYAKGLGTNANAEATFNLGGECTRFTSIVGIDDTMDKPDAEPDVAFQVLLDGVKVYDSGVVHGGDTRSVDVDVTGATELRLAVDQYDANNWWDRSDWAAASVTCQ